MEKIENFKSVCFKIGLVMTVFYVFRVLSGLVSAFLYDDFSDKWGEEACYIIVLFVKIVAAYIIPIAAAWALIGVKPLRELYKKPPRLAKALGNFPAMYGLGQMANILTILAVWLITKIVNIEKSFAPISGGGMPKSLVCGMATAFAAVFCAALFEEFIARGIFLEALKPYGTGFAVMMSAFLFGIMHGNFEQFFYAFIMGIVLGYIAVQTGSILAGTIMHAMFNSVAAFVILFMSTKSSEYLNHGGEIPEENMPVLAIYGMFTIVLAGLLICGIALAFKKLSRLRIYKMPNAWTDITGKRKTVVFFTRFSVIITLALAADAFAGGVTTNIIFEIIRGSRF
ncbi:MAG: CPBP family intramembrane metalloprotease [Oscillospiraceae bacterium]|jgi:membrane protease YdiL (CAAX protease family)|nr:CPBP family intramembrane metalloprotease [Oscillospiraceae bacterium]